MGIYYVPASVLGFGDKILGKSIFLFPEKLPSPETENCKDHVI